MTKVANPAANAAATRVDARLVLWLRIVSYVMGVSGDFSNLGEGDMGLNVLQLSQVKPWRRRGERAVECFLGGMIGAIGAILILGWIL